MISTHVGSDRRRHRRLPVKLSGRYMLPDRSEHACVSIDISPGGLLLKAGLCPYRGQRVVVYLQELGRIEGVVTRVVRGGFAMTIMATSRKREKFVSSLTWLGNCGELDMADHRRSARIIPARPGTVLTLSDGSSHAASIDDFSTTGASVRTTLGLTIDGMVVVGKRAARVARATEGGFAVEFMAPLGQNDLSSTFEL